MHIYSKYDYAILLAKSITFLFIYYHHHHPKNLLVIPDHPFHNLLFRFVIYFKRIERGKVVWPTEQDDERTMVLAYDELKNIIIAPGITQKIKRTEVWKRC